MKRVRTGPAARARHFLRNWSLPRQAQGQSHHSDAARSEMSDKLRPRLEQADTVGTGVCPYCAVGCSTRIFAKDGRLIHVEGNPESPINAGTLCPKGATLFSLKANATRLTKVKYRAPHSTEWEERPLDWAMDRIAHLTKQARDETFAETLPDGRKVNHTLGVASLGGATLDNEENYLIKKVFGGGLGMVWIENQARVCHSNSVPGLGASFGRGAATMAQWDLANSDCVLIMGSNMAEAHPIAFRFVMQAKERGAKIIHVDPRFTRTSALADIHASIRTGTDIAFLGGVIRHLLENDLWFRDWAVPYTNLATIIDERFESPSETEDGRFSGWNEKKNAFDYDSWQYENMVVPSALSEHYLNTAESFSEMTSRLTEKPPRQDPTLQHPMCVYQILRRHYAPYTPEMVEEVTGCPKELFLRIANTLAESSGPDKTGAIAYAVGWNHHTVGVQMIRASTLVQSLLGNIGRPGGGIIALRGHCSIQGSTDIPTLYNMLPSYLPQPNAFKPQAEHYDQFLEDETIPTGWWNNFPKYFTSLLRAWYGDAVGPRNEWGFHWLPKIVGDHSQLALTLAMNDGLIKGLFLMGQNVVIGGSNSQMIQRGLGKLDWLVVRDTDMIESANFWQKGHPVRNGEVRPEDIGTEIFVMPAELAGEKEGTFTNTHRLVQWHDKVIDGPGDSRSELWFMYHLGQRMKALYADSDLERDAPIQALTLDYPVVNARGDIDAEAVLKEINGYTWPDKEQLKSFQDLKDDGSTACGSWLYSGTFPGFNKTRERNADGPDGPGSHLGWAFAWPANRRTLYNRASADPEGKPWSEKKRLVWWDEGKGTWQGDDAIDFEPEKRPDYRPDWEEGAKGMDAIRGDEPFIMMPDGRAAIYAPSGLKDGPLPTHYEPVEGPGRNPLHHPQRQSPVAKMYARDDNPLHEPGDPRFPHILTTYRLTEHHCGGTPTRGVPHTAELQPEGFAELPPALAAELGVQTLDWIVISTARGEIETRAMVTDRLRPLRIDGRRLYQVGMPWHFGWEGEATGDIANVLTAAVGDPNTSMHENKSLTCAVRAGRLNRGVAAE
ncbi:formate dehydrogenase major subunit [Palleronia marisminoris]|uniref:formate dehydrogenase n=1 Tax=Palleronia marisminoris TaxID=315423 RepID=UPI0008EC2341|nr:formate dehydrogenase [Palleronia marisminoris]SFH26649.1 formate dehydrogenase major subunit [Palleronia marisminoris]